MEQEEPGQSVFVFEHKKARESFFCSTSETAAVPAVQREQPYMGGDNRSLLLNWVLELCHEPIDWSIDSDVLVGNMGVDVYFLAVSLYERYAATTDITFEGAQLVGAACIWIAFKFLHCQTDVNGGYLEHASLKSYTVSQLKAMEVTILKAVNWELHVFTPLNHLEDLLDAKKHEGVAARAVYFMELYSLMPRYAEWKPRDIAVACIVMGCKPQTVIDYGELLVGFNRDTIMDILMDISHAHKMLTQQLPPFTGHMEYSAMHIKYKDNEPLPIVRYAELERRMENRPLGMMSYFSITKKRKMADYSSSMSSEQSCSNNDKVSVIS